MEWCGVFLELLSSLVFAGMWAERWEDKKEETGKVGRIQTGRLPISGRGVDAHPVRSGMVISIKDFNQGSNMIR